MWETNRTQRKGIIYEKLETQEEKIGQKQYLKDNSQEFSETDEICYNSNLRSALNSIMMKKQKIKNNHSTWKPILGKLLSSC